MQGSAEVGGLLVPHALSALAATLCSQFIFARFLIEAGATAGGQLDK